MSFIDPQALPCVEPKPGWRGRFFHSQHMTFAYYDIAEGATLHAHHHANEEVWHILDGELELTLGDETRRIGPGSAVVVPPETMHAVRVVRACRAIVVDHPVRREVAGKPI